MDNLPTVYGMPRTLESFSTIRSHPLPRLQRLIFEPEQFQDLSVQINSDQGRYLFKVLRLKISDQFIAMDGQGHWWLAQLETPTQAQLIERMEVNNELSLRLILIAAPPKGNGFESVIHSATELGVQAIYPLISERTLIQPNPQKIQRWQKIATEATEQSLRQVVPKIHEALNFQDLAKSSHPWDPFDNLTFFCSTQTDRPHLQSVLNQQIHPSQITQITVITGPEGGWSPQEENQFVNQGMIGISLGKRILRSVTAPINALSLIAAFCEANQRTII